MVDHVIEACTCSSLQATLFSNMVLNAVCILACYTVPKMCKQTPYHVMCGLSCHSNLCSNLTVSTAWQSCWRLVEISNMARLLCK